MTSKASWAVAARADKWWQDKEPQEVIDIVEELVDNANSDPSSAAQRVCALYEPLIRQKPKSVAVLVGIIYGVVFAAVRAIGQDEGASTRLRNFILAIQQVDDVLDESGEQVLDGGAVVWRDLPGFSLMFREYCISKLPSFLVIQYHRLTLWKDIEPISDRTSEWLDQAPTLLNASTFGALFLSKTSFPTRMSFFVSVALIDGLEVSYPQDQIQQAIMYIPPATAWICHAGDSIHKFCVDRDNGGAVCGQLEPGCTWEWTGGSEFSIERWQFWKRRLGELAAEQSLDEHVRSKAKEAEAKMDSIERAAT
jgi:hypothetical protein